VELLTLDQINAAADRLRPVMRLTPVIASRVLSERTGEQVWLKCENLRVPRTWRGVLFVDRAF
jgi:threonine dehydratase